MARRDENVFDPSSYDSFHIGTRRYRVAPNLPKHLQKDLCPQCKEPKSSCWKTESDEDEKEDKA